MTANPDLVSCSDCRKTLPKPRQAYRWGRQAPQSPSPRTPVKAAEKVWCAYYKGTWHAIVHHDNPPEHTFQILCMVLNEDLMDVIYRTSTAKVELRTPLCRSCADYVHRQISPTPPTRTVKMNRTRPARNQGPDTE